MLLFKQLIGSKVKKNSLANFARVIIGLPVSIFFTYFVLKKLSLSDYGAWALSISFFSYFSFFDLGLTPTITRFISIHEAKKEKLIINKILNTSLVFYILLGLLLTLVLILLKPQIMQLFFKNADEVFKGSLVFNMIVIMGLVDFVFSTFLTVVNGFQKMEVSSLVDLTKSVLFLIFAFVFLSFDPTLSNLVTAFIATTLVWACITVFACKSVFKDFTLGFSYFDPKLLSKLLKFGFQTQFLSINLYFLMNFDKLLVGHFLGVRNVAYLDIALKLINQARSFVSGFISPILPAAAEKTVLFRNKIYEFYRHSFNYVLPFSGLVFGGLLIFSPLLTRLWLGTGFEPAAKTAQILAIGHFFNMLTGPGCAVLLAKNYPKIVMIYALLDILVMIIFSFAGIYFFGFFGAIWGTTLGLICIDGSFVYLFPKYFSSQNAQSPKNG